MLTLQVPATWHWSIGKQSASVEQAQLDGPGRHMPASQASAPVHDRPSSHGVPSGADGLEQAPVAGSHEPAAWHASVGAHVTTEVGGPQSPDRHVSPVVHALASSQGVPLGAAGVEHRCVTGSQVPATWH